MTNYYIVRQNGELKLAIYGTLEIAKADSSVELMHDNPYTDRFSAIWDLNYFKKQELEDGLQVREA